MLPKRLDREVIYENEWVSLYADKVGFADGRVIPRHHLVHFDYASVGMVIENEAGDFLLIQTPRYCTQSLEWEIPAGRVEAGEAALNAALRETLEETGYQVSQPGLMVSYYPMDGISDKVVHLYRAQALRQTGAPDPQEVTAVRWFTPGQVRQMIARGEIRCGLTLTGLLLAQTSLSPVITKEE